MEVSLEGNFKDSITRKRWLGRDGFEPDDCGIAGSGRIGFSKCQLRSGRVCQCELGQYIKIYFASFSDRFQHFF